MFILSNFHKIYKGIHKVYSPKVFMEKLSMKVCEKTSKQIA